MKLVLGSNMLSHPRPNGGALCAALLLLGFLGGTVHADYVVFESEAFSYGSFVGEFRPNLVTSENPVDGPGNHSVATPGTSVLGGVNGVLSGGINHDGVGQLSINIATGPIRCTGSLLSSGQHILTAAHCVTNGIGNVDVQAGSQMYFDLPGGAISFPFGPSDISVHPSYNGDFVDGFDVAVINLNTIVPATVPRYDIVAPAPFTAPIVGSIIGFGEGGHGNTGSTVPMSTPLPSTKRFGQNVYEADGLEAVGVNNPDTQLTYDFDNGLAANDAFGVFGAALGEGSADTGLGNGVEAIAAPGDSGGPTFVNEGGVMKIAGTSSYGFSTSLLDGTTSDINGVNTNSSFGEFSVDARIANQSINDFIRDASAVPEPTSFLMLSLVAFFLSGSRRIQQYRQVVR